MGKNYVEIDEKAYVQQWMYKGWYNDDDEGGKLLLTVYSCDIIFTDDLRHIVGSDTARRGLLTVFDLFQTQEINRRIIYVLLEGKWIVNLMYLKWNEWKEALVVYPIRVQLILVVSNNMVCLFRHSYPSFYLLCPIFLTIYPMSKEVFVNSTVFVYYELKQ